MKISKKLLALALAAAVCCMMIPAFDLTGVAEGEEQQSYTEYQDVFINQDGTFNTEAEGFPADYVFDLNGLKTDWSTSTSNFFARVPKKFFQAVKSGGKTVTLVDGLGTKHIIRPENIAENINELTDVTFNVGSLYRKSASYGTVGQTIATNSSLGIDLQTYKAWDNFAFLQCVSGGAAVTGCEVQFSLDVINHFPNLADNSPGGSANYFYQAAQENRLYVYEYASNVLTARPTQLALALSGDQISFKRNNAKNADDCGNKQFMFSDRPLKAADVPVVQAWQPSFIENGFFAEEAVGFPQNYVFDFSAQITTGFTAAVTKEFFHAVKQSGRTVTIIDKIGVQYRFAAKDIAEISQADFAATVPVGGRYRTTSSYITVAKNIAFTNMAIANDSYNHKINFGFLEVETGNGIAADCDIRVAMNFGVDDPATAKHFYDLAAQNSLYVYQYSSNKLADRATQMAVAKTEPQISVTKSETGSMQLLFSDQPLRTEQPDNGGEDPTPEEPQQAADYKAEFVQNGQFVTSAAGFPANYTFKFGSYSASLKGYAKDLFQAIKNSGRIVTLIDRYNISYSFDGSKMADIPAETRSELFQLQSLYKSSASYQTVMAKIAGKAQILDGFYMNEDWVILDVQPWTDVSQDFAVNNSFPTDALISVNLNNGLSGTAATEVGQRFAQYAREGKLKAYFYDKTSTVQDVFVDKEPLVPTVNDKGEICFNIKEPATLIFSRKDLLTGRNEPEINTNPYEMRIKKDGKNISDGYTIELGDIQYLDLLMENGKISDHEYVWEVIGPGSDSITLTPAKDANNLTYVLNAVKETESGKAFQIRVSVKGETNNFVTTGLITVVDTVFGKNFVEDGSFNTQAAGFPQDYVFVMRSSQYRVGGNFLNAIAQSKREVVLVDSSNIRYVFNGAQMEAVPEDRWNITYAIKALYKDSASYQGVMLSIAYEQGYTEFVNNQDYIIIDFQAHGEELPFEVTTQFKLESKSFDPQIAAHFAQLFKDNKLYVYVYSKTIQDIYKPFKGISSVEDMEDYLSMQLLEPVTLVFSAKPLMNELDEDKETSEPSENDNQVPDTGNRMVYMILPIAVLSTGVAVYSRKKKIKQI